MCGFPATPKTTQAYRAQDLTQAHRDVNLKCGNGVLDGQQSALPDRLEHTRRLNTVTDRGDADAGPHSANSTAEWGTAPQQLRAERTSGWRALPDCSVRVYGIVVFRQRTGVPWRDLPARFSRWKTVYERHRRWSADGTWERIFAAVLADADAEGRIDWSMVSVDSTTCRAHQHAAGARRRPPWLPGKDARPGRTAPTRGSDAPGAA
ncbi:hypothetical protein GCM10010244_64560 [Streptomyces coeruleorubidus]|nr:hypothetical protein GCM10010244_64560 [Streptomyces bellus]